MVNVFVLLPSTVPAPPSNVSTMHVHVALVPLGIAVHQFNGIVKGKLMAALAYGTDLYVSFSFHVIRWAYEESEGVTVAVITCPASTVDLFSVKSETGA
jgi:hypothetical protein